MNVDYHLLRKRQVIENKKNLFVYFSWILVAIPTAIAAFYLPVTLMCLLYFRIYRETVKRRKELHLLQAQHHTSYSQSTTTTTNNNNTSNGRLTKNFSTIGVTSMMDHDESMSTDSNRSHGIIKSTQRSSIKKKQKNQLNHTFNCCYCDRR